MKLLFDLAPGPSAASDVASHEFRVSIDGGELIEFTSPAPGNAKDERLKGNHESAIHVEQRDTDKAGNIGGWATADLILLDDQAPPVPGQIGLVVTGQIEE